jgi:hypothetical protein
VGDAVFFRADDGSRGAELWTLDGASSVRSLLLNTDVTLIDPVSPSLATVLPLDATEDAYRPAFSSGNVDPELTILGDGRFPWCSMPSTLPRTSGSPRRGRAGS